MRNDRLGETTPAFMLPYEGRYLWNWFNQINNSISRIKDGVCHLIPPSEFLAWSKMTGNVVHSVEYDILQAMDAAFCDETNKELRNIRSKQEEEQQKNIDAERSKRGRIR